MHEFERLALVNPDKEFLLVHNDVTLHQLLPGSLKQRVVDLFGKSLDRQLIPVSTETSLVKITGFVSHPENAGNATRCNISLQTGATCAIPISTRQCCRVTKS